VTLESNREVVRSYCDELWGAGRLELVERLFSRDFVDNHPDAIPGRPAGRDGIKHDVERVRGMFPDFSMIADAIICEDDRAGLHWSATGTQTATNKQIMMSGLQIFRLSDGQIVERWAVFDRAGVMRQLAAD
jgi:predicted ester cyclase